MSPESEPVVCDVSRTDAVAIVAHLRHRLGDCGPKSMPRAMAAPPSAAIADLVKAAAMIEAEILASIQRCEALEAAPALAAAPVRE